jgi:hypothetical protein
MKPLIGLLNVLFSAYGAASADKEAEPSKSTVIALAGSQTSTSGLVSGQLSTSTIVPAAWSFPGEKQHTRYLTC